MSKLTLSVDPAVVARAKRYAKQNGVSVSRMVEAYLSSISAPPGTAGRRATPVLDSVFGMLKGADERVYRKHLDAKYR